MLAVEKSVCYWNSVTSLLANEAEFSLGMDVPEEEVGGPFPLRNKRQGVGDEGRNCGCKQQAL